LFSAIVQNHPEHIDIIKLILPNPFCRVTAFKSSLHFTLRLPFNFNGNGYSAHHVEMRNWYPEPAVYDAHGWHPMPFLYRGGAYHETADYLVEIDAPPAYRRLPQVRLRTPLAFAVTQFISILTAESQCICLIADTLT
jgi:hypothetical protein